MISMRKRYFLSLLLSLAALINARSQSSCFSFFIGSETATQGDTVDLDVHVNGAEDLMSMSYALFWNPDELDLIGIDYGNELPGLDETNFNLTQAFIDQGQTALSWFNEPTFEGLNLPDSTVIFSLQFEVLANQGTYAGVRFGTTSATVIEFANSEIEPLNNYSLLGGGVGVDIDSPAAFNSACIDFGNCSDGGELQPTISGSELSYTWKQGETTVGDMQNLPTALPGQYTLEVMDTSGATLHGIFQLLPDNAPYVSTHTVTPSSACNGALGSIEINAAGGSESYTYSWSNGETTSNITGLTTGYYTLTLTDSNGCSYTATYEVGTTNTASFLTAFSQACTLFPPDSSTVDLTCVVWDGGTPPYTFDWNTGFSETDSLRSTLQDAPGNGIYNVTITDAAGCVHLPDPVAVDCIDGEEPDPCEFITASSYECTLFADGTSLAHIDAVVWEGGSPPYIFEWSTGFTDTSNTQSTLVDLSGQGVYSVTITDSDTCSYVIDSILVDCSDNPQNALLSAEEVTAQPGGQVCVDISLNTLADFTALQTNISWADSVLSFDRVENGALSFVDGQIDTSGLNDALLSINWSTDVPEGVIMEGETVLFQLCFDVVGSPGSISGLNFFGNNQFTLLNGDNIDLNTGNGAVFVQGDGSQLSLSFGEKSANPGEAVCLPVTARNFNDITSMQFSADWDPEMLTFDSLETGSLPGLSDMFGINYNTLEDGKLTFAWIAPSLQPATLPDDAVLFEFCFTVIGGSGTVPVSFSNTPTAVEVSNEQFVLPVQLTNGAVYLQQGDVWPGDTDVNQIVEPEDLLPIGLAFGAAGPPRPNASISWTAQFAGVWDQRTPISNVDYKHIDTNGDGFIDEADTLAIVQNMDLETNLLPPDASGEVRLNGAPLYVRPDSVVLGEPATFDIILGESSLPANDVYGIAFTIVYDSSAVVPGSARASFAPSWLGTEDSDLLTLYRNRPAQNRIDLAMTRTDGLNQSGQGIIGQLHITIQDVIFLRSEAYELEFRIEDVRIISVSEEELPVTTPATVSMVEEKLTNTQEAPEAVRLDVFPLPARDQLWLRSGSTVVQLAVVAVDGRVVLQQGPTEVVDVSALPAGWYTLRVWTKDGLVNHPIIIE